MPRASSIAGPRAAAAVVAAWLVGPVVPPAKGAETAAMSPLGYLHGRLAYRKKSTGLERGREDFWLTRNRDGSRTLRSLAMTDDSRFVRDVTFTLGADRRPQDVFVRLQVEGRLQGTGYFRTAGDTLHVVTDTADAGHAVQAVKVPPRFHVTSHAVMLDGWPFWALDPHGPKKQEVWVYNTSTKWNGTDGPSGRMETIDVADLGEEDVTVPAGTFRCRRYSLDSRHVKDVPTSQVWVTGDDLLLVRYDWSGFDLEYVLTRLVREDPRP